MANNKFNYLGEQINRMLFLFEANQSYDRFDNSKQKVDELGRNPQFRNLVQQLNKSRAKYMNPHNKASQALPYALFLDEYGTEEARKDWMSGTIGVLNGEQRKVEYVNCQGFKNPEYGDIIVKFRGYAALFKPQQNAEISVYKYSGSAMFSSLKNAGMNSSDVQGTYHYGWMDIVIFDDLIKRFEFKLRKEEIPVVFREKAPRFHRPDTGTQNKGHQIGRQNIYEQKNRLRELSGIPLLTENVERVEFNGEPNVMEIMNENNSLTSGEVIAYHGTPHTFTNFSYDHIGKGNDEDGLGFYFSSATKTAGAYTSSEAGKVMKCKLRLNKTPNTTGGINQAEIKKLMAMAPNLEDSLTDWDENPRVGLQTALKAMCNADSHYDALQNVRIDFYKNSPVDFLQNLVKLGYDGVALDKSSQYDGEEVYHYVMFNPESITFLEYVN